MATGSGRSIPQQQNLKGLIQRLAKVKRKQPLHQIAFVTSSVCGSLLDRTDDELSLFKANVANIASWCIFFDENPDRVNQNVTKKIRKGGQLCDCLETGERLVDGEAANRKTFSLRRKAPDLNDVNKIIDRRLSQFIDWWGKEYEVWKEKVQAQGAEGVSTTEPLYKLEDKQCPRTKEATSDMSKNEERQSPGSVLRPETTTVSEITTNSRDTASTIENVGLPTSSEGTSPPRLVSNNSFSGDTLKSTAFYHPPTSTNQEEGRENPQLSRQSDPSSARHLTPADSVPHSIPPNFASQPEPASQENNIDDFFDGDDPEDTEYDVLIYHEDEDEDEVKSIRDNMQRQLKDKSGNTTAKVCIPSDFHYKGLRPAPLMAAVEKSTSVAFFLSKCTGDMLRKESILSQLDFLMTTAKNSKQHIKTIFILVQGNKAEAEALLKNDNPYLQTTAAAGAVYDVTSPLFSKKMTQLFRENQHLTIARRVKTPPPPSQSDMGRPITHESSSSASVKQLHKDPPHPSYTSERTDAFLIADKVQVANAIMEKLQNLPTNTCSNPCGM